MKRVVQSIAEGTISRDEAATTASTIREGQSKQEALLQQIDAQLLDVPTSETIAQVTAEGLAMFEQLLNPSKKGRRKIGLVPVNVKGEERLSAEWALKLEDINERIDKMTNEDQRSLCETVFGHKLPDDRRAGVYIRWFEDKHGQPKWVYAIRGLLTSEGLMPRDPAEFDGDEYILGGLTDQPDRKQSNVVEKTGKTKGKRGVTRCASH